MLAAYFWVAADLHFVILFHTYLFEGVYSVLINVLVDLVHVEVPKLQLLSFFIFIKQCLLLGLLFGRQNLLFIIFNLNEIEPFDIIQ